MHRFEFDAAGTLRHYIADELRATVAAEHVAAYHECQPDAPAAPPAAAVEASTIVEPSPVLTTPEETRHEEAQKDQSPHAAPRQERAIQEAEVVMAWLDGLWPDPQP